MFDGSILLATLLASSPAAADGALPDLATVQAALNALERCRGLAGPECPPPLRQYRVHGAQCMPIAPEEGRATVACRVDHTLAYPQPERDTRHRDTCLRFARRNEAGDGPGWVVVHIRDRPCEMPSTLARDPHPVPDRAQLERALVSMLTCRDTDGLTHCGMQPTAARVEAAPCTAVAPGAEGRARALCRISASVTYGRDPWPERLTDICVQLDRYTAADESPAAWGATDTFDKARCEAR